MFSNHIIKKISVVIYIASILIGCGNAFIEEDTQGEKAQEENNQEAEQSSSIQESPIDIVYPRNIGKYLYSEILCEMGDEISPESFFDKEMVIKDEAFDINLFDYMIFDKFPPEDDLYKEGQYEVTIAAGEKKLNTRVIIIDTTPPEILIEGERVFERGDTILYRKGVTITDNSREIPELSIDSSEVDINVFGTYPVFYEAIDRAGNIGVAEGTITIIDEHIPTKEEVDGLADEILNDIIKEDMTEFEEARAIFDWCQQNIRVTAHSRKDGEIFGAYDGFYHREGDCYTSYAASSWLMDRCGIKNIALSKHLGEATHYWSLVNTGEGWYHFDCSRQKEDYHCFMQTDNQVKEYAEKYRAFPEEFEFEQIDVPERETKIIYVDSLFQ